jgi:rfaE bifunctional protein nucleotidyltransferase chain/domain
VRGGPLVVLGDSLLDVDLEGTASRLAPDAPVPVVDCLRERQRAGGAGLAAVLAARLGGPGVTLITALGTDRQGDRLREILGREVEVVPLPLHGGTPCKIRVQAAGRALLRLDTGDGRLADGPFNPAIRRVLAQAGAVLVSDYGRGVTAHPRVREMLGGLRRDIPVIWDPHPAGPAPVRGVRLATPNAAEASAFAAALPGPPPPRPRQPARPSTPIAAAAADAAALSAAWATAVSVTLGECGALLSVGAATPFVAPAKAAAAADADTCGAGDCFAATAAHVLRSGGVLTEAVVEAVRAAAEFVARGGARGAPALTVPQAATDHAAPAPGGSAWDMIADIRRGGGKIVATGGCFDLLHAGHVSLLRDARQLGDCLVVCLNSDASVRRLKGPGRPLVPAEDRARVLSALECVDGVLIFAEATPDALLERLRPDVWVKGGDYAQAELAESAVVRKHGGEVVLLPYLARVSTSQLVAAARLAPVADGQSGGGQ